MIVFCLALMLKKLCLTACQFKLTVSNIKTILSTSH